jgi:ParB family transcriptional regulator, chromosome partitioning protein
MELDLHALDLRFADLRVVDRARRKRLQASIADVGQQTPIVVIAEGERYVLIDGYARVAALTGLRRDTALTVVWPCSETEALIQHHQLAGSAKGLVEEAWLLAHLRQAGLGPDELARRFARSRSWVSRRLALVTALPRLIEDKVRAGMIPAQAAMKSLVPLARANKRDCLALVQAVGDERLSVRAWGQLYVGYRQADKMGKQAIVAAPLLYLKAAMVAEPPAAPALASDLEGIAALARRAARRIEAGALQVEQAYAPTPLWGAWRAAELAFGTLTRCFEEAKDAGSGSATGDLHAQGETARDPGDRPGAGHLADDCARGAHERRPGGPTTGDPVDGGRAPATHP